MGIHNFKRRKQIYIAPGDEDMPLPIEKSPWHIGREAIIPKEHWDVITEFAERNVPGLAELLELSCYFDEDFSKWSEEKTQAMYEGLKKLSILISQSEPLTPEVTDVILENHPPGAHIDMIKAVLAVIEESQRIGQMFDSYIDS